MAHLLWAQGCGGQGRKDELHLLRKGGSTGRGPGTLAGCSLWAESSRPRPGSSGSHQGSPALSLLASQVEQLANPKAWINAATQIFFSLGLGFGSLIAFASYNKPSSNCQRHAVIVSLINSSTSIFASIVTFSIYGFKATFNYESCVNK